MEQGKPQILLNILEEIDVREKAQAIEQAAKRSKETVTLEKGRELYSAIQKLNLEYGESKTRYVEGNPHRGPGVYGHRLSAVQI